MNKNLSAFLNDNSFTYDSKSGFFGNLKGFQVSGLVSSMGANVSVSVHLSEDEIAKVTEWLNGNKRQYALQSYTVNKLGVRCVFVQYSSVKKCIAYMNDITGYLSTLIQSETATCPFCGQPLEGSEDVRLVGAYGAKFRAHEHCFDEYAEQVAQSDSSAAAAPNNTLRGVAGAIIGSLLGCIIWGLLYFVGYVAVVAAIVTSIGAAFLWDKFGGKNNKTKIIVIWVVTIVMILVTMLVVYCIDTAMAMSELGMEGSVLETLFELIDFSEELRNAIIFDTAISLIFIAIGNVYTTISVLKTQVPEGKSLIKY